MYTHEGNKNLGKMIFAYIAYHNNKIKRNIRCSESYHTENKSRLWLIYKNISLLWYKISHIWYRQG